MSTPTEKEVWEQKLIDAGLTVDQGSSPSWLTYGWQYRDTDKTCAYSTEEKRPHKRTVENESLAKQLLQLMHSGLSQNGAAKALGIGSGAAANALKRYRSRQ